MTREDFEAILIKQYSDCIEEMIHQSEFVYRSQIDYEALDFKVKAMIKAAKVDGLKEDVIWNLLERRVPGYISHLKESRSEKSRIINLRLVA
jgi:hypothetical protein